MTTDFAAGALRLSGLAMRLLGWSPDAFWDATPAELAAIFAPETEAQPTPLGRADLAHLMEMDPDGDGQ